MTMGEEVHAEPDSTCEAIKNDDSRCGNPAMNGSRGSTYLRSGCRGIPLAGVLGRATLP